jgi:hypothetical protein
MAPGFPVKEVNTASMPEVEEAVKKISPGGDEEIRTPDPLLAKQVL